MNQKNKQYELHPKIIAWPDNLANFDFNLIK